MILESLSYTPTAKARFPTGKTVTIALYDETGTTIAIDTSSCSVGTNDTTLYYWSFSNVTTQPTNKLSGRWVMSVSDGSYPDASEDFYWGGWIDEIQYEEGPNQVTINVETVGEDNIPGVLVQVLASDGGVILDQKSTDSIGVAKFALDDGTYVVRLSKSQYTFTVPESLVVSGDTEVTYNGSTISIVPGAGAAECEVSVFASSQRPTIALSKLTGTAQIVNLPVELSGIYYPGEKINGTYDSINKRIYWILPQGATVRFKIDSLGISSDKAIPEASSADYSDL